MLPQGPKRGGIRETVGFEERKAERGQMGGLGDGAWHGVRWDGPMFTSARPTAFLAMLSLRTSDRCHWCGNP